MGGARGKGGKVAKSRLRERDGDVSLSIESMPNPLQKNSLLNVSATFTEPVTLHVPTAPTKLATSPMAGRSK